MGARRLMRRLPRHDQVEVVVDPGGEAGVQRHRRAELLDDRRARDDVPGAQVGPPQHRRVDVPVRRVEADRAVDAASPVAAVDAGRRASSRLRISGRVIGPIPETRRLTHSTCCESSPEKS